mgnify:CR=1 FL=1
MYFSENYKNNKFEINFINTNKYLIFKIPHFLNKENYEILKNNFPKIDKDRLKKFDIKKNNYKYRILSEDADYEKLLERNFHLREFHNEIFSKNFFSYFFVNLKKQFFLSRKNDLRFLFKLIKPKSLDKTTSLFKTFVKRQIEYSYIFNGGKIVPHTDSRSKLLSLMLYFPEAEEENNFNDIERGSGTLFWNSDIKNLNNEHLTNTFDEKEFKKKSKKLFNIPFEKYHLFGFIRNEYSWHSVEKFDIREDYIRKSININFNI